MIKLLEVNALKANIKLIRKLEKHLDKCQKDLEKFFHVKINQPLILFINSRNEIDRIWGEKTPSWLVAWAKNNCIFTLRPEVYTKQSDHKDIGHFWKSLKHELCHLYFIKITGGSYPKWLNEGLACYFAGQIKRMPEPKDKLLIFKYYDKSDAKIYAIGSFWVNFLIKKYGKHKILKLIKGINAETTQKAFAKLFYRTYKINYSKESFKDLV